MKTNTQIKIDRFIGIFNSLFVNPIVRLVGKLLHINHNLDKDFKTIAVCKYKGMGSIIQSTLLLQALRNKFPEAKIIFVSTKANQGILNKIEIIDEQILIDDSSFIKLINSSINTLLTFWKQRIDVYIDLEIYSNFSSLITTMSMAKNRLGYYRQASHYRKGIYTHMMYYNIKAPIANVYLQMSNLLNCNTHDNELYTIETNIEKEAIFQTFGLDAKKKYIIINPNASDLRIERRWNSNNFIHLIQKIVDKYKDYQIVLIGAPNEKIYVDEIYNQVKNGENIIFNVAAKTSIEELIALIKYSDLIITNDTGPMHLAFSLKVRNIALFGPCSPFQYGISENCSIIYMNVYCSPCVHEFDISPCKGNNLCMQMIDIKVVYNVVERLFSENNIQNSYINSKIIYKNQEKNQILGVSLR